MRLDLSKARDTVETETPQSRATSFNVTMMEHTFQSICFRGVLDKNKRFAQKCKAIFGNSKEKGDIDKKGGELYTI